jgi:hypothetical protein
VKLIKNSPSLDMAAASPPPAAGAGRRIVVAVDEGEESMHALSWCLANVAVVSSPAAAADTVVLLHARRPRPVYAAMDSSGTCVLRCSSSVDRSVHELPRSTRSAAFFLN